MVKILKKYYPELLLAVSLTVFILCKISALPLPYFWDELGVYSRAGLYLHDNGLSLLPDGLPPELSRGHPLLFSFVNGLAFSLFGDSVITGHILALFFSVVFILVIFYITAAYFDKKIALFIAVSVLAQPLFFAQSVMVLPEIMLALFIWLSIYFFSVNKMLLYICCSCIGILIKETAIIIPFVVIIADLFIRLAEGRALKKIFRTSFIACSPFYVFCLFLFIQKQQNGWYFFPYHADAVKISLQPVIMQFADFCKFLTMEQGRLSLTIIMLAAYPVILWRQWIVTKIIPGSNIIIYFLALCQFFLLYNDLDPFFCLAMVLTAILLAIRYIRKNNLPQPIIYCIILTGTGLLFSATNFYMNRYVLYLLPALFILYYYGIGAKAEGRIIILAGITAAVVCFGYINMESNSFHYDEDMSYENYLHIEAEAIDYADDLFTGDSINVFANFPLYHALSDTRLGYTDRRDDIDFHLIKGNSHPTIFDYIMIADPGSYDHHLPQNDSISVLKEFSNETGQIVLYKANYK